MSYNNFIKAKKLSKECEDYSSGNGVSFEIIREAEKILNIKFSKQLEEYLNEFSFIEFFGVELYGIIKEDFSSPVPEGCMVEWTISERKESKLNENWVPIRFEDDGDMAFLDFSDVNEEGEPKIITASFNGKIYKKNSVLSEDFGDYLLNLVEESI